MRLVAKGCGRNFLFWSHLKPKSAEAKSTVNSFAALSPGAARGELTFYGSATKISWTSSSIATSIGGSGGLQDYNAALTREILKFRHF